MLGKINVMSLAKVELRKSITTFFPAFNDEMTIGTLVIEADRVLRELSHDYEIIVVNDGSADGTQDVLDEISKHYPRLRIIKHESNMGYGAALISGFTNATKDMVFYTDGDGQYDVKELTSLIEVLSDDIDVVNGYKISRSDPIHRIVIGKIYNFIVKFMFNLKLKDVDCDYRVIRKNALEKLDLKSTSGVICVELVRKLESMGCKFREVPVHHYFRAYGKSQFFNFRRVFAVGIGLIQLWYELVFIKGIIKHE